jgi:hypothetical protein
MMLFFPPLFSSVVMPRFMPGSQPDDIMMHLGVICLFRFETLKFILWPCLEIYV